MSKTIQLIQKIKVDDIEVDTITIRRPRIKDQRAAEKITGDDADKEISLFAGLCGISPESIEELDMADYGELQDAYQSFLTKPGSLKKNTTGKSA